MYHWNTKALFEQLKGNTLSEKDKMKYYLATSLLFVIATSAGDTGWVDRIHDLIYFVVTLLGIIYCFKLNDGKGSFVEKSICLGWPIGIKTMVVAVLLLLPLTWLEKSTDLSETATGIIEIVAIAFVQIGFYLRLGWWLKES